jgi:hypothetical protein
MPAFTYVVSWGSQRRAPGADALDLHLRDTGKQCHVLVAVVRVQWRAGADRVGADPRRDQVFLFGGLARDQRDGDHAAAAAKRRHVLDFDDRHGVRL